MGGGDSSHAHSSNTEKSKSKMSLTKLLSQRKTKVGCFKTSSKETSAAPEAPRGPVVSPTRNMFRGYCDPESRTTRLTLCCAMTESSCHTPPHSHPLAPSPQMEKAKDEDDGDDDDDEAEGAACMVVYTQKMSSQTSLSPAGQFKSDIRIPEADPIDDLYDDTSVYTNENYRGHSEFFLNRAVPYLSTPGNALYESASSTTTSSSRGMTSPQVLPQRFSTDSMMLSKVSSGYGRNSAMNISESREIQRRPTLQGIIENNIPCYDSGDISRGQAPINSLASRALVSPQVLHLIPAGRARERNFLQRRGAADSLLGCLELERALPSREIRIFVGTWNMNGHPPPYEINEFILPEGLENVPDIFAIGTQESCPNKFEWEVKIQEAIGPSHVMLHSASLGTLHLALFIRRELTWFCSVAEESSISVRPGAAFKTKGAVAISFILFGTSFLFITAHLTAHKEKVKARVQDIKRIVTCLNLPKMLPVRTASRSRDVTQNYDSVFWCGDLNFRLSQDRDDVINWLEGYRFPLEVDLRRDQLTKLITQGTCLSSFHEAPITFPPTYKYDPGTQNFDTSQKNRTPSYTDRILYKSKGDIISCVLYNSAHGITTSDHKPVWGLYKGAIRPGIDTTPLTAGLFNRDVYLEGIQRRTAELRHRRSGLSAVCSIQ